MGAPRTIERGESRGETLLGLMVAGIVALTGLISLMMVVGEWWLLVATFATLLASTAIVVVAIARLLGQSGDSDRG